MWCWRVIGNRRRLAASFLIFDYRGFGRSQGLPTVAGILRDASAARLTLARMWLERARARRIAMDNGIRYAYTGNVHDPEGQSTRCHKCAGLLIERDWYRLGAWRLTGDGRCANCGTSLPGVFDGPPGTWGPRRLPVRIAKQ